MTNIILAAGGTGGHMVPAHALAAELTARGHGVALMTDERGARIPGLFDGVPVHVLPAGRLAAGRSGCWRTGAVDPGGAAPGEGAVQANSRPTRWSASAAIRRFPRCWRRVRRGMPTILHEQNAVLGRVNRLLAGEAAAIATAYPEVERLKPALSRTRSCWSAIRCATASSGWARRRFRRSTISRR